jgi:molybdopterin converting factor small subunit
VEVRIRFGTGIARFAPAPLMTLQLPTGATVADAYDELAAAGDPDLTAALKSALPIVRGEHADREQPLAPGDELALLAPISGG